MRRKVTLLRPSQSPSGLPRVSRRAAVRHDQHVRRRDFGRTRLETLTTPFVNSSHQGLAERYFIRRNEGGGCSCISGWLDEVVQVTAYPATGSLSMAHVLGETPCHSHRGMASDMGGRRWRN